MRTLPLALFAAVSAAGTVVTPASALTSADLVRRCVTEDWQFREHEGRRVWRVTLRNACRTRFRCTVMANITTPGGNTQGSVVLGLPLGRGGRPSLASHRFPMKPGSTHSAQGDKQCAVS